MSWLSSGVVGFTSAFEKPAAAIASVVSKVPTAPTGIVTETIGDGTVAFAHSVRKPSGWLAKTVPLASSHMPLVGDVERAAGMDFQGDAIKKKKMQACHEHYTAVAEKYATEAKKNQDIYDDIRAKLWSKIIDLRERQHQASLKDSAAFEPSPHVDTATVSRPVYRLVATAAVLMIVALLWNGIMVRKK